MGTLVARKYGDYSKSSFVNDEIRSCAANPFSFNGLYRTLYKGDRRRLRHYRGPKVIIAGSGMMTGGRILSHAIDYLPDKNSRILFVGYPGEETLARAIVEGEKVVYINNIYNCPVPTPVNAHVSSTDSFSSHADQGQLLDWLGDMEGVKKVILVHGDNDKRKVLASRIGEELGIYEVALPKRNEKIVFEKQ
jgi:metallo-beta-lactamase family protein